MEIESLERELRDFLITEVQQAEPPVGWWDNIVASLEDRKRTLFWKRFVPRTRLAWAMALLTLLVFVVILILVDFSMWYLTDPSGSVSTKVVPQPGTSCL
ncbi:hypothetical protein ACFLXY_00455 [Chloroflexota bacterium]